MDRYIQKAIIPYIPYPKLIKEFLTENEKNKTFFMKMSKL